MRRVILSIVVLAVVVPFGATCFYTVDRTEYVYLTQFGKHVHTFDGRIENEAGLHFKWPFPIQSVQRLDRRLQYFDLPGAEVMTRDEEGKMIDKTLTIDAYVCWEIPDARAVDQFIRTVGTTEGARSFLTQQLGSKLGAAVGQMRMNDLVSTDAGKKGRRVDEQRDELRTQLLNQVAKAEEDYGIKVVDVRLRRTNHPESVRKSIYDRIISEREKLADFHKTEGERKAGDIRSASDKRIAKLKTRAEAESVRMKGQADARADKIRSNAQKQDPEFYAFLKKLDAYKRVLGDNKSLLLLSTDRKIFDLFNNPPAMKKDTKQETRDTREKDMSKPPD
jgi:membrane protease subunit HflC